MCTSEESTVLLVGDVVVVVGVHRVVGQGGPRPEVVLHIQHVGQQRLGGALLQVQLLHLVLHHNRLAGDLLAWTGHPQEPGQPLQEYTPDLRKQVNIRYGH